jgi:hypothetical protein
MTVLEPTREMQVQMAMQAKADFEWALNRLVELLIEELGPTGATVAQRLIERLQVEWTTERSLRTLKANVDSTPLRE